jgi:excisionase family DNA binding protein
MKKEKDLLSSKEVRNMLGISKATLYNWCKQGRLRFVRLPSGHKRYFRVEIEAILKNNK